MKKALADELAQLKQVPDNEIDLHEIPEQLDWSQAVIGKYYRPLKKPVSLRIDADVISWFKSNGKGYQSYINTVLRNYFLNHVSTTRYVKEDSPKYKSTKASCNNNNQISKRKSQPKQIARKKND